MSFFKAFLRIVIGAAFGIIAALALVPALAAITSKDSGPASALAFLAPVAIGALLGAFAPTVRRSFGRGFLLSGVCILALPLSAMLLSGRAAHDVVSSAQGASQAAATAVGAGIAGAAITGIAAFIGLFLGAIFIIIGLVLALGGRREVVVIDRR